MIYRISLLNAPFCGIKVEFDHHVNQKPI